MLLFQKGLKCVCFFPTNILSIYLCKSIKNIHLDYHNCTNASKNKKIHRYLFDHSSIVIRTNLIQT